MDSFFLVGETRRQAFCGHSLELLKNSVWCGGDHGHGKERVHLAVFPI